MDKSSPVDIKDLHEKVALRMASAGQRYTSGRQQLVEALASSTEPMDITAIAQAVPSIPQSSAYRSLAVFTSLGITHRITGAHDSGFYELSEEFIGSHHHHAVCTVCGRVTDIKSTPKLERALQDAAKVASDQTGFDLDAHRFDLTGICPDCQK